MGTFFSKFFNDPLNFHLNFLIRFFLSIFYSLIWFLRFNMYTISSNSILSFFLLFFYFVIKYWSRNNLLLITYWFIIILFCFQSPIGYFCWYHISISRLFQQALYHVLDSILVALTSYYYISKRALGAHAPHGAIWCLGIQQFLLLPLLSVQLPVRPLFVKFFLCESTKITKIQSESLLFQPKTWGNLHTPRLFWRCHAYYYNLHQVRIILFHTLVHHFQSSDFHQFSYMILDTYLQHLILLNLKERKLFFRS